MNVNDPRYRGGPQVRVVSLPGGWLGKLLMLCLAVLVGVLALSFSLAILLIVFIVGATIWAYFVIRRALVGSPSRTGRTPTSDAESRSERAASGRVIDGEVLGRDEPDTSADQRR
jgi:hypothetical protein